MQIQKIGVINCSAGALSLQCLDPEQRCDAAKRLRHRHETQQRTPPAQQRCENPAHKSRPRCTSTAARVLSFEYKDTDGDDQTASAGETVETQYGTLTIAADGEWSFMSPGRH